MAISLFPHQYAQQKGKEEAQKIAAVRKDSEQNRKKITDEAPAAPNPWKFGCLSVLLGYLVIGIVGGILLSVSGDMSSDTGQILGLLLIAAWTYFCVNQYKNKKKTYEASQQGTADATKEEDARAAQRIGQIQVQTKREIEEYRQRFEAEAQRASVEFTGSELATEAIAWMAEGFEKLIRNASRAEHLEKVEIPFAFRVYRHKITCNLGTYDFNEKRCALLNGPLEQAALARAIASEIMVKLAITYPCDPGGTENKTDISYTYAGTGEEEHVAVLMTYVAANGSYRPAQQWKKT